MESFEKLPVIPLRGIVVFPLQTAMFDISRPGSLRALEQVVEEQKRVFLVAARDSAVENPHIENLYGVGTVARVRQVLRLPDGSLRVLVGGERRALLVELLEQGDFAVASIAPMALGSLGEQSAAPRPCAGDSSVGAGAKPADGVAYERGREYDHRGKRCRCDGRYRGGRMS